MAIGASEAVAFWTEFLQNSLARRGLRGVKLLISDGEQGSDISAATRKILGATWQRCRVHFARNLLAHAAPPGPARRLRSATAFAQEDADSAKAQWRQVADQLGPKVPKLAVLMDEAEHDVLAYMKFPQGGPPEIAPHKPEKNGSMNAGQAPHQRRRHLVPNEAAITRLVGAILLEQNR